MREKRISFQTNRCSTMQLCQCRSLMTPEFNIHSSLLIKGYLTILYKRTMTTLMWSCDVALCSFYSHMLLWTICGKIQHCIVIKKQPFLFQHNCYINSFLDSGKNVHCWVLTHKSELACLQINILHINGYLGSEEAERVGVAFITHRTSQFPYMAEVTIAAIKTLEWP